MRLSLRAKLAAAVMVAAAVPLGVLAEVVSARVGREFAERSQREFASLRRAVEAHFALTGERLGRAVEEAAQSYSLREALLAHAAAPSGDSQAALIAAVGEAAGQAGLPLLTLHDAEGTVLASAQEPERFDVRDPGAVEAFARARGRPALGHEQGMVVRGLALGVARALGEGGRTYWLAGGRLVDDDFLRALSVSEAAAVVVLAPGEVRAAPTAAAAEVARLCADAPWPPEAALARVGAAGWLGELLEPLASGGAEARLLVAISRRPLEQTLGRLRRSFALTLAGALLLAWLIAALLARRWSRPVEELVRGLDRVAHGDLAVRIPLVRDDELGRLVEAFHAMTADLSQSRERLLQAERVAAWREIARRLAHEIKNPLSPIALSIETLRRAYRAEHPGFSELLEESTRTVLEEVERLRRIVQEFSDFARLPRPRLRDESLHEVIRGVATLFASGADGRRIALELAPGEGRFRFDPDQLNRLLVNLVKNALEASPPGGEVRVTTDFDAVAGSCTVEVVDQGPGVSVELHRSLFRPYVTTKEGGTGLGLAIAHRIAEEHGGTLALVNPGEPGARFRLVLPLDPPVHPDPPEPA